MARPKGLPWARNRPLQGPGANCRPLPAAAKKQGLKVLLIDDGPEVCSTQATLELELGYAGEPRVGVLEGCPALARPPSGPPIRPAPSSPHPVTTCASGSAALGHARKAVSSFDVVLAEVSSPRAPMQPRARPRRDRALFAASPRRGASPRYLPPRLPPLRPLVAPLPPVARPCTPAHPLSSCPARPAVAPGGARRGGGPLLHRRV